MTRILIDADTLQMCVSRLASDITAEYLKPHLIDAPLIIVGVLDGASRFCADLVQQIAIPYDLVFMTMQGASKTSEGILKDIDRIDFKGKNVLIIESIVNTGKTIDSIAKVLEKRGAVSIKVVTLILRVLNYQFVRVIDFAGFGVGDELVFGYGISHEGKYAELNNISTISASVKL